jgi:hypothetical protein
VESLRLGLPIIVGLTVIVAFVGGRRLPARSAAWTWAVSLPIALVPVISLWAGVALLGTGMPFGVAFVGVGVVFLAIWAGMTRRSIARVQAARSEREVAAALDEPVTELMLAWVGFMLITGLVGGV